MDYAFQNHHHHYAAPPTIAPPPSHPQPAAPPQPPQSAGGHPYSSYYSNANPNPYSYQDVRQEDPSQSAIAFTDGGILQAADPYAAETGYEMQAAQYGYQQYQHPVPYPYTRAMASSSSDQSKRKFMIKSNTLDLESKKQKIIQGGAAADSVRVCTICNVVCNSDKVFASHLAGDKHVLKAMGRHSINNAPNVLAHLKKMSKITAPKALKKATYNVKAPPKIIRSFLCEVCKIECNCQEALNSHKMGKKHKFNLLKLQESIAPKPPPVSSDKNVSEVTNGETRKKNPSVKEGLQVKKDRILQGGADVGAVMECVVCDVVCNSKSVYDSHVAGKKHLAMMNAVINKQQGQV